jgi:hypothetical protein
VSPITHTRHVSHTRRKKKRGTPYANGELLGEKRASAWGYRVDRRELFSFGILFYSLSFFFFFFFFSISGVSLVEENGRRRRGDDSAHIIIRQGDLNSSFTRESRRQEEEEEEEEEGATVPWRVLSKAGIFERNKKKKKKKKKKKNTNPKWKIRSWCRRWPIR